jgi:pyruvate kinase
MHMCSDCKTTVIGVRQTGLLAPKKQTSMPAQPKIRIEPDADAADLRRLLDQLSALREDVIAAGAKLAKQWGAGKCGESAAARALNLGHYVALRSHDLTDLQYRLAAHGLSSLGRSEAKVLPALDALIVTLRRILGEAAGPYPSAKLMRAGQADLEVEAQRLFGPPRADAPRARILATLPPEAADDRELVARLIETGMDCARINCAHDDPAAWGRMIANIRAAEARFGLSCPVLMDIAGPKCRIAEVDAPPKYRIQRGHRLAIAEKLGPHGGGIAEFTLNFPQIVDQLAVGAEVFIDDGKALARVVEKRAGRAEIEVYAAREKGVRLKPDKGVNFPTTEIELPPLTAKDFRDLDFVAEHADLVGFSFVQRVEDVELLQAELAARRSRPHAQAIVLKIETPLAVRNLPRLIVQSIARNPTGVMIARGDLAVEIGFARLSEMQEEILWLCEAAHTPVIWATQVLDQFVRDGVASRSEMTDAAASQGAECVMLNKGPHLVEGVAFLKDVLTRMDRHYAKKFPRYTRLRAWN